ncbi:MAG: hypothetical protein H6937_07890 [Burkholderiales bacterium]|nr:hypothetical protein [Burkholderiales bacterium]MDR4516991.1 hypothetical protein [Nitrosomonas sp.]
MKSPDKKGWLAWKGTGWLAKVPWSKEKGPTPTAKKNFVLFSQNQLTIARSSQYITITAMLN